MKVAVVQAFERPPRFEEFPEPAPGDGEVLVHVRAAALHPVVRALAGGGHYGSTDRLPFVPGVDGVGLRDDGAAVYFGNVAAPYGSFAERAAVPVGMAMPLPAGLDGAVAAAIANPGMAAWLALAWRAQTAPDETVLVLGATGVSGRLAVQYAKRLGAGRVIAAGRDERSLSALPELGADAVVSLDRPHGEVVDDLRAAAGESGIQVIVDYLWGPPAEAAIAAVTRTGLSHQAPRVRLVQVGECAGSTITLPAAVLRSSGVEVYGSGAGTVPLDVIGEALPRLFADAASGAIRVDVERVALSAVGSAWGRNRSGVRTVLVP